MATRKSTNTPKHKRKGKARDSDRAHAAELVRRYRTQEPFRNAFGEVEGFVTGDYLAECLEVFAEFGTWEKPVVKVYIDFGPDYEFRPYTQYIAALNRDNVRATFKSYRAAGIGAEDAKTKIIEGLAELGYELSGDALHELLFRK
jgi:hypothetical protein